MIRVSVACDGSVFRTCVRCVALTPGRDLFVPLCVCVCVPEIYYSVYIHFRDPEPEPMNQRSRVLNIGLDHDSGMYGVISTLLIYVWSI